MFITAYLLSTVLVIGTFGSAFADLTQHPRVMAAVVRLGFQPSFARVLAALKILGATGVALGVVLRPLGIFATECLTAYFLCAVLAHVRVKDPVVEMVPATGFFLIALAATITHMAT